MSVWAVLDAQSALAHSRRDITDLVDVSLHSTRETSFADRAATCGMLITGATSQALYQATRRSVITTDDVEKHARLAQDIRWSCVRFLHRIVYKRSVTAFAPPQEP